MLPVDEKKRSFARGNDDQREGPTERAAVRYAIDLGYYTRKYKSPGRRSAPDRIFKHEWGDLFFIEFKASGVPPSDKQLEEHRQMRAVGLRVYVVDNLADAKAILDANCL